MANPTKVTDSVRNAARTLAPDLAAARATRRRRQEAKDRRRRELLAHYTSKLSGVEQAIVRHRTAHPGIKADELAVLVGTSAHSVYRALERPSVIEALRLAQRSAMEALTEGQLEAVEVLQALLRSKSEQIRLRAATVMVWPLVRKPLDPGGDDNALARAIQEAYAEVRQPALGPGRPVDEAIDAEAVAVAK